MAGIPGHAPRRYTREEKLALVTEIDRRYQAGEGTLRKIASALGTTETSYHNWRNAGIEPLESLALEQPKVRRAFTRAERARFVNEIESMRGEGLSIESACRALGISETAYRRWKRDGEPLPTMRSVNLTALVPLPHPVAAMPTETLTVIAPSGHRVEGLGIESAAALLRALA